MKFAYTHFPATLDRKLEAWRPMVKAKLFGQKRPLKIDMLVDSGSDYSVLPKFVLDAIGVQYTGEEVTLFGVGNGAAGTRGYVSRLRVEVAGFTYDGNLVALDGDMRTGLLGQRDFFLNFTVTLDYSSRLFFVSPVRSQRLN